MRDDRKGLAPMLSREKKNRYRESPKGCVLILRLNYQLMMFHRELGQQGLTIHIYTVDTH